MHLFKFVVYFVTWVMAGYLQQLDILSNHLKSKVYQKIKKTRLHNLHFLREVFPAGTTGNGRERSGTGGNGRERPGTVGNGRERSGTAGTAGNGPERPGTVGNGQDGRERPGTAGNGRERPRAVGNSQERSGTAGNGREQPGTAGNGRERTGTAGSGREQGKREGREEKQTAGIEPTTNGVRIRCDNRSAKSHLQTCLRLCLQLFCLLCCSCLFRSAAPFCFLLAAALRFRSLQITLRLFLF